MCNNDVIMDFHYYIFLCIIMYYSPLYKIKAILEKCMIRDA